MTALLAAMIFFASVNGQSTLALEECNKPDAGNHTSASFIAGRYAEVSAKQVDAFIEGVRRAYCSGNFEELRTYFLRPFFLDSNELTEINGQLVAKSAIYGDENTARNRRLLLSPAMGRFLFSIRKDEITDHPNGLLRIERCQTWIQTLDPDHLQFMRVSQDCLPPTP